MTKRILIVSFTFPPAPGIGGRRWAKFAKYLNRIGYDVHVISAENIHNTLSEWMADIKGLKVDYLPYRFPKILSRPVKGFLAKVWYRIALMALKIADNGNYYDRAIFWKKQINSQVEKLINQNQIDTVIVTGAPFRLVYYVVAMKRRFPDVKFISDFRDLWTADVEVSAFSKLNPNRIAHEKNYEKETVNLSDWVFTVSGPMRDYFAGLTDKNNCLLVPNGFDPDDLLPCVTKEYFGQNRIRLIFAGTLYNNIDYIIRPFFKAISRLKAEKPELYEKLELSFYGKFPRYYHKFISEFGISEAVHVYGERPYSEVLQKVKEAHYGILFINDLYNHSFSTKFCEYIGQKKRMMVVAKAGITSEFILEKGLGYYLNPEDPYQGLMNGLEEVLKNGFRIVTNEHFDTSVFSIKEIARKMEEYL